MLLCCVLSVGRYPDAALAVRKLEPQTSPPHMKSGAFFVGEKAPVRRFYASILSGNSIQRASTA